MASIPTESSPLLSPPSAATSPRPHRSVTFNPQTTINHPNKSVTQTSPLRPAPTSSPSFPQPASAGQPVLSTLHSKLRRRNSHGSPLSTPPMLSAGPKIGPQRTTKNAQKLKLLPNLDPGEDGPEEESGREVYSQFTRIKDPTARRDAARLGKPDRDRLPRVTAYCTASAYRLDGLMKFLRARGKTRGANPKQFDECIYSPYCYERSKRDKYKASNGHDRAVNNLDEASTLSSTPERRYSDSAIEIGEDRNRRRDELIDLETDESVEAHPSAFDHEQQQNPDLDTQVHTPEVFLFDYGTVVIWGMTVAEERRFLNDISKFEKEKLSEEDVQTENFNFYYTREYQARIYNDFISLREKKNYMTKLAISHALSQSVKVFPF